MKAQDMTATLLAEPKGMSAAPQVISVPVINSKIVDAVKGSIDQLHANFLAEKPQLVECCEKDDAFPCIAGIITFLGEEKFSLSWVLPHKIAVKIAHRFSGFEIPFDSSDMGDVVGELVNVIAGEVILQLERRKIKVNMSLPTVVKGDALVLMPENNPEVVHIDYVSSEGTFWMRIAGTNAYHVRYSGK